MYLCIGWFGLWYLTSFNPDGAAVTDPAVRILDVDPGDCNLQKLVPYKTIDKESVASVVVSEVSAAATTQCPVIIKANGATVEIPAGILAQGRGTIFVEGSIKITGNITYGYTGSYPSVNLIPNLGVVATEDIIIEPGVTKIDASLYAHGKVKTCNVYRVMPVLTR